LASRRVPYRMELSRRWCRVLRPVVDIHPVGDLDDLPRLHDGDPVRDMPDHREVEIADRMDIYDRPQHPYTSALLSSIPVPTRVAKANREPIPLKGEIPSPVKSAERCRFHTRCPIARAPGVCSEVEPPLVAHGRPGRWPPAISLAS